EFNQQTLTANRSFDAGVAALNRRDFGQAATIFRTIDVRLLEPAKAARLKELMLTPELQPSALAQGMKPTPEAAKMQQTGFVNTTQPEVGVARATDSTPEKEYAKQVQALQEVKFQELRSKSMQVMREANERFQAGDTDRALEMLQEYSATLRESQLEPQQVTLLRRPVEARLQQFKTLKAQRDFEKLQANTKLQGDTNRAKIALAEENKQKKIAELMKQYNAFFKEAKYKEAEMYAMRAHELDPDNP